MLSVRRGSALCNARKALAQMQFRSESRSGACAAAATVLHTGERVACQASGLNEFLSRGPITIRPKHDRYWRPYWCALDGYWPIGGLMAGPEIDAMSALPTALADLEEDARGRVLRWAAERYGVILNISTGSRHGGGAASDQGGPGAEVTDEEIAEEAPV